MKQVTRYIFQRQSPRLPAHMAPDPKGVWVSYSEYAELEREVVKTRRRLAKALERKDDNEETD